MGNRSGEFNQWFEAMFLMAMLTLSMTQRRLAGMRVLIVDGSLVKRRCVWEASCVTFEDWLRQVFGFLESIIATMPALQYVVFLSDMYDMDDHTDSGGLRVIECIPKACTHESRYGTLSKQPADPRAIPDPEATFQPDHPVAGIRSADVFGVLPNRMQLDRMFTDRFFQWARQRTLDNPDQHVILHGGVRGARALSEPRHVYHGEEFAFRSRIDSPQFCRCSEGDPRLGYWACEFSDMAQAWWSCDTDLFQVLLQHMRRMSRLPLDEVPDTLMIKQVSGARKYFDARELYRLVMHKMGQPPFNFYPAEQHPVDIIGLLLGLGGNDMCHPPGVSQKKRDEGKDNDGIRMPFVLATLAGYGREIGPILRSSASHFIANSRYCVQGLPCEVFHSGVDTYRLGALLSQACAVQQRDGLAVAQSYVTDERWCAVAIGARIAWAIHYYGCSFVPGYVGPTGDEVDTVTGRSLYGFHVIQTDGPRSTSMGKADWTRDDEVHDRWIAWGCHLRDAHTSPPSPAKPTHRGVYVQGDSEDEGITLAPTTGTLDGYLTKIKK